MKSYNASDNCVSSIVELRSDNQISISSFAYLYSELGKQSQRELNDCAQFILIGFEATHHVDIVVDDRSLSSIPSKSCRQYIGARTPPGIVWLWRWIENAGTHITPES